LKAKKLTYIFEKKAELNQQLKLHPRRIKKDFSQLVRKI
jgi:hypothetical protein